MKDYPDMSDSANKFWINSLNKFQYMMALWLINTKENEETIKLWNMAHRDLIKEMQDLTMEKFKELKDKIKGDEVFDYIKILSNFKAASPRIVKLAEERMNIEDWKKGFRIRPTVDYNPMNYELETLDGEKIANEDIFMARYKSKSVIKRKYTGENAKIERDNEAKRLKEDGFHIKKIDGDGYFAFKATKKIKKSEQDVTAELQNNEDKFTSEQYKKSANKLLKKKEKIDESVKEGEITYIKW